MMQSAHRWLLPAGVCQIARIVIEYLSSGDVARG
jgi:hypothetical protein